MRGCKLSRHLQENDVRLPNGDRLTPRHLQLLGIKMGFAGTQEEIHYLLEEAFVQAGAKEIVSHAFLKGFSACLRFDSNPIFAILHEAIYAQGSATSWACDAVQKEHYSHYDDFDDFDDFRFYGEMIFPWMFDEISELRDMKGAADILASYEDWPDLYDKSALSQNTVPTACVVYYNDMFVNARFSRETIDFVPNMKGWYTSEYEHCGLRADGENVLSRLIDLARGEVER